MVTLNRIYTRTGDGGQTRLATGETVAKFDLRVEAYGAVDETNATVGLVRLHTSDAPELDAMLARIQNELFDLGADLATPRRDGAKEIEWALRIVESQVTRLETDIDSMNADLPELNSFILPGGTPTSAFLHQARTVCRRAERLVVQLKAQSGEIVSDEALKYLNRLSDFLFVASRFANGPGGDVLWRPGASR
jgi:cob(I)alamin adenosyltransferase